jgi:hypothetical protein
MLSIIQQTISRASSMRRFQALQGAAATTISRGTIVQARSFHQSPHHLAKIQFNLADIGEGITECELIQW